MTDFWLGVSGAQGSPRAMCIVPGKLPETAVSVPRWIYLTPRNVSHGYRETGLDYHLHVRWHVRGQLLPQYSHTHTFLSLIPSIEICWQNPATLAIRSESRCQGVSLPETHSTQYAKEKLLIRSQPNHSG